ncbi:unnamed protein product [Urochloa humidicola]
MPALYSHVRRAGASVKEVVEMGLCPFLVPRLTHQAAKELEELEEVISFTSLNSNPDVRTSFYIGNRQQLSTSQLYRFSTSSGSECAMYKFIWRSYAPPRVKFFAWLLVQDRLQCKANLLRKNIVDTALCELCNEEDEDANHLISGCSFAKQFWSRMGWSSTDLPQATTLWETKTPAQVPDQLQSTFLILCCWHLWKHRHDVVFRGTTPSHARLQLQCRAACRLWQCRLPPALTSIVDQWCTILQMA